MGSRSRQQGKVATARGDARGVGASTSSGFHVQVDAEPLCREESAGGR